MILKEIFKALIIIIGNRSGEANFNLPKHELEALARCFLPSILAFFQSEEGRKEFEEWKNHQELKKRQKPIKTE